MAESDCSFVPFHVPTPSLKLEEIAARDLGETEELKKHCLQQLRTLIRDQKVTCVSYDDFLLRFLRYKKFDIRRSFDALQNYAHQRRLFHKGLPQLQPGTLETILRLRILGFLPYLDSKDRIVYFFRAGVWNVDICSADDALTVSFVLLNYIAEKASSQITGMVFISDLTSVPLSHFPHMLGVIKRWKNFMFNCIPIRYSSIHVVSKSVVLKYVSLLAFPFVPKKIVDRIVFHEDIGETFFEYFPVATLPDIYGGTFGPSNHEDQRNILTDYLQKMKEEYHQFQEES